MSPFIMIAVVLAMGLLAFFSLIFSSPPKAVSDDSKQESEAKKEAKKAKQEAKKDRKSTREKGNPSSPGPVLTSAAHFKESKPDDMRLLTTADKKRQNKKTAAQEEEERPTMSRKAIKKLQKDGWDTVLKKEKKELSEAEKKEKEEQKKMEAAEEAKRKERQAPRPKKTEGEEPPKPSERSQAEINEDIKKILAKNKEKKDLAKPKTGGGGTVRRVVPLPTGETEAKSWNQGTAQYDDYEIIEADTADYPALGSPAQ